MYLRFCYEWPQNKRLMIFLYTEEICSKYFVSLKANKIEAFVPQTICPYLLPYHFSILFYLFETYRDEVCSCFKYYTFLLVTFLKHTMLKHFLIWGGSAYLFSFRWFLLFVFMPWWFNLDFVTAKCQMLTQIVSSKKHV